MQKVLHVQQKAVSHKLLWFTKGCGSQVGLCFTKYSMLSSVCWMFTMGLKMNICLGADRNSCTELELKKRCKAKSVLSTCRMFMKLFV